MKKLLPLLLLGIVLTGCQKEPDWGKLSNDLLVYTHHDTLCDFSQYYTYYLPDSVLMLDNSEKEPRYISVEDPRARNIVESIESEMNSRGYVEVHDNSSADIGIITSYIKRTNTYVGYDYPYWWYDFYYYWPFDYWDPYYNGWYPYYPYPVTYSYTTGTLVVEMIALKEAKKESQQLPFIWTACMAGVESSNQVNISKAISGIYQAFEQSPYINHKAQ